MGIFKWKTKSFGYFAVPLILLVQAGAAFAGSDTVSIEDIGPTEEMLRRTPSDEGKISDGDESVVDKVFVYLDGCPLVMLDGIAATGTDVTMIDRESDAATRKGCIPDYDATTSRPPRAGMKLAGRSQQSGLLVQMWQAEPQRDADGVLIETGEDATLIIEIASLLPLTQMLLAEGGPLANPHLRKYNMANGKFDIPGALGDTNNLLVPAVARKELLAGGGGGFNAGFGGGDSRRTRRGGAGDGGWMDTIIGGNPRLASVPIPGALSLLVAGITTIGGLVVFRRRKALV